MPRKKNSKSPAIGYPLNFLVQVKPLIKTGKEWNQVEGYFARFPDEHETTDFLLYQIQCNNDVVYLIADIPGWTRTLEERLNYWRSRFEYIKNNLGEVLLSETLELIWESDHLANPAIVGLDEAIEKSLDLKALKTRESVEGALLGYFQSFVANKAARMEARLRGRSPIYTGSKRRFRLSDAEIRWTTQNYNLLKPAWNNIRDICKTKRQDEGDERWKEEARKLFQERFGETVKAPEDLLTAIAERGGGRRFKYKPNQVAVVNALRWVQPFERFSFKQSQVSLASARHTFRLIEGDRG